ncbi:hypothetical protein PFISCL1PPCAC_16888, partial [Pristionchus fissidentatus]
NSLEYEAFKEAKGRQLSFEVIRKFVVDEIEKQREVLFSGGDANQFLKINVCPLDKEKGATRCLLWNAGSNCLKQLDDLFKLEGVRDCIRLSREAGV